MTKKQFLILAAVVGIAGFLGGLFAAYQGAGTAMAQNDKGTILRARRFVITDSSDKPRVIFATEDKKKTPLLALYDSSTNPRAVFSLSEKQEPAIAMLDGNQKLRISIVTLNDFGSIMVFLDENENTVASIPETDSK